MANLGHRCKFQWVSCLGSVTARHSSSGCQPNFVALNRGRHLYSAGRPSRWELAHISSWYMFYRQDVLRVTQSTASQLRRELEALTTDNHRVTSSFLISLSHTFPLLPTMTSFSGRHLATNIQHLHYFTSSLLLFISDCFFY